VNFLKHGLELDDLDIEFYYDIKEKLLKNAEHRKRNRLRNLQLQEMRNFTKPQIKQSDESKPGKNPQEPVVAIPQQSVQNKRMELKNRSLNNGAKNKDVEKSKTDTLIQLREAKRNGLEDARKGDKGFQIRSSGNSDIFGITSSQYKPKQESSSALKHDLTSSTFGKFAPSSNQKQSKPFSWMSVGDNYSIVASDQLYLTNLPELTMKSTKKSDQISRSQILPKLRAKEEPYLIVREPYLMKEQKDFYKTPVYPKLPKLVKTEVSDPKFDRQHLQKYLDERSKLRKSQGWKPSYNPDYEQQDFMEHLRADKNDWVKDGMWVLSSKSLVEE
jgi:hypothetical protein